MPSNLTYPGVYIEEIPSGVRTIVGVSTSVTAFAGSAKRGPVNKATRVLNYSDYERCFGGLSSDSEMSYAVRQFFLNGGSEAWIVRLAYNAGAASKPLANASADVLLVTALDEGYSGNNIEVRVDYHNDNPASYFNLTFNYTSADNSSDNKSETFTNLSMNSKSSRYVETVINDVSQLVKVERIASAGMIAALGKGQSLSGALTSAGVLFDVSTKIDSTHDQFQVSVNGSAAVTVQITQKAGVDGRLFGSVTNYDIVEALQKQGVEIERRQVRMPQGPLKQVGDFPIEIELYTDVVSTITVSVLGEA